MDWIHCNSCFIQPGDIKGRKFWLTGCGHMFCDECILRGPNDTYGCKICKKSCSTRLLIPSNLQGDVKDYFSSVESLIEKFRKVLDFQNSHRQRLVEHNKSVTKKFNAMKSHCKEYYEEIKHLQHRMSQIEKENAKLRQAISASQTVNFQFPTNTPSPYYINKPGIFTPPSAPGSQKPAYPRPKSMKHMVTYGAKTPNSMHFPSPSLASVGTPHIQQSTPDYVSQLRNFSFTYPGNSQDD